MKGELEEAKEEIEEYNDKIKKYRVVENERIKKVKQSEMKLKIFMK